MPRTGIILACLFLLASPAPAQSDKPEYRTGPWHAWLESPGGELPFGLVLARTTDEWRAWIVNGRKRIEVPRTTFEGTEFLLDVDHYDSTIKATLSPDGHRLDGEWKKRRGPDKWLAMPFHATSGNAPRFAAATPSPPSESAASVDGRWKVKFSKGDDAAVAEFHSRTDGTVAGTILTSAGDYGYLAGVLDGPRLRLSTFDGAQATLLDARFQPDGTLKGDLWSGDSRHETWTAARDIKAATPDGFNVTRWNDEIKLSELSFRDISSGETRSLADPAFVKKVRIIELFGSWCPNCHDAAELLVELDKRYRDKGLGIVGIAFERSGDVERSAKQIRRFLKRHGVKFPVLAAPDADENEPASFRAIDKIRAYPTTIFLDSKGKARAVHSGYAGPAAGRDHQALKDRFVELVEELLAEDKPEESKGATPQ